MSLKSFLIVVALIFLVLFVWYTVDSYQATTPSALRGDMDKITSSDMVNLKNYDNTESYKKRDSFFEWTSKKVSSVLDYFQEK